MKQHVIFNNSYQEATLDNAVVDAFAHQMKVKLYEARQVQNRHDWSNMSKESLQNNFEEAVRRGNPVNIANYAMFLWWVDA